MQFFNNIVNKMHKKMLKHIYKNSLNVFFNNKKEFPFFLNSKICKKNVHFFYDTIISFLDNLIKNEFYILNLNKEFNLYNFIKYSVKKKGYKKEDFNVDKTLKTTSLIKNDNIIVIFKRSSLFLKFNSENNDFFEKLNKYEDFKLNFILFTDKKFKINKKKIKLYKFFSNSMKQFYLNKYIRHIKNNIKNLKLNIYNKTDIEKSLKSKLFNQSEVIESTLSYLKKLNDKKPFTTKPIASWLLCGPSGTGKTEFAKILSNSLYGSINNLLKIDMSEYLEKGSVSKLIGASPGYVGYGQNTVLSKKFNEYSSLVVLFDEIEKADVGIFNIMLQILDEGKLLMSSGKLLNFNKSFVIFTSNLGFSNENVNSKVDKDTVLKAINKHFRIEFLNRINKIVVFDYVDYISYKNILNKFVTAFFNKFNLRINVDLLLSNDLSRFYCNEFYGSRPLKRFVNNFSNVISIISDKLNYSSHYDYIYSHNFNCFKMNTVF